MNSKINQLIDRVGFEAEWEKARAVLRCALSRGVCPDCGAPLRRVGVALTCTNEECSGLEEAQRAFLCYGKVR